jgi:hypothetical protein
LNWATVHTNQRDEFLDGVFEVGGFPRSSSG